MLAQKSSWSKRSTTLFMAFLSGGVAVGLLVLWPDTTKASLATPTKSAAIPSQIASMVVPSMPIPSVDTVLLHKRVDISSGSSKPPIVFAECVAQLCDMGVRTAELAHDDEIEEAMRIDGDTRQLLDDLLAQFSDAGERSLAMLVEMASESEAKERPPLENTKLGVLQILLEAELSRRNELAEKIRDRSRINALVQAILDSMPISSLTAQMGDRCLRNQPLLRIEHEPSILHMLQLASEEMFSRNIATHMLLTLWDNLKANGERTSTELSQLALLLLDESDPSKIVTACRQLLEDPQYRALALSWLRERNDSNLANDIAQIAARDLPVQIALDIVRELTPLLQHVRGTYLGLGSRAPTVLADAYRQHLAANTQPSVRRELVMGVGMLPDSAGLEIAELAIANDPSPQVRIQAMYVFTIHAQPEAAEQAVSQLLDDPAIANHPLHLGAIVWALQNLEHGDPNTIARLGARLQSMSLSQESRQLLNEILSRSLPGGIPALPPAGG